MKIVVIGGTGLIGTKLVAILREYHHDVVAASPASGVNTLTGEGLTEALDGAAVVVDVSNSPSFGDAAALKFFVTATGNLLDAAAAAGVAHHVALSVVGTDRLLASGYFRAKMAQETLIRESGIPYTIVHATQFYEFLGSIADAATDGGAVRLPPVLIQPMAADDVATAVGRAAIGSPTNGIVEVGGPQQFRLDALIRRALGARHDPREVLTDPQARYWGIPGVAERTLVPDADASLGEIRLDDWLGLAATAVPPAPHAGPAPAGRDTASVVPQTVLTMLQQVKPPFIPDGAEVMTIVVESPPGAPSSPPHRHPGPTFGYMLEGEMLFELEGEPERVIRAGEAFWEPGGDPIHYQDGNNRSDVPSRFVVVMLAEPGEPAVTVVDDEELAQRKDRRAPPAGRRHAA